MRVGRGIVLNEPSVVAIRRKDKRNSEVWVGEDAKKMIGRVPGSIEVFRPLREGVIANFEIASLMLKYFIQKVHQRKSFVKPRVIISVPAGVTPVERRAVRDSALNAGAHEVFIVEEAMAAAMGAGLPVTEPMSNMIVDIGGGTTEVAIISLTGIVYSNSSKIAGDRLDMDILNFVRKNYSLLIGPATAEQIKVLVGLRLFGRRGRGSGCKGPRFDGWYPQNHYGQFYRCCPRHNGFGELYRGQHQNGPRTMSARIGRRHHRHRDSAHRRRGAPQEPRYTGTP